MAPRERAEGGGGFVLLEEHTPTEKPAEGVDLLTLALSPVPAPAPPGLVAATIVSLDEERRIVALRLGSIVAEAALDDAMETAVARTALARGERVIAQCEGERWVVLGALRTAATPGVDVGDEFTVRARRISVLADHEFSVAAGAASLVLRARGYVETIAEDITSRASSLHKIVGRMIRLN